MKIISILLHICVLCYILRKAIFLLIEKKKHDLTNGPNINIHAILLASGHKDNHPSWIECFTNAYLDQ